MSLSHSEVAITFTKWKMECSTLSTLNVPLFFRPGAMLFAPADDILLFDMSRYFSVVLLFRQRFRPAAPVSPIPLYERLTSVRDGLTWKICQASFGIFTRSGMAASDRWYYMHHGNIRLIRSALSFCSHSDSDCVRYIIIIPIKDLLRHCKTILKTANKTCKVHNGL